MDIFVTDKMTVKRREKRTSIQPDSKSSEDNETQRWFDLDETKAICGGIWNKYRSETPKRLKIIDAYLLYVMMTGAIQLLYALIVGSFPFNSILSGFISCVASFVLGVGLRLQVNEKNKSAFMGVTNERAFADFIFAHIILRLVVINFIG